MTVKFAEISLFRQTDHGTGTTFITTVSVSVKSFHMGTDGIRICRFLSPLSSFKFVFFPADIVKSARKAQALQYQAKQTGGHLIP